MKKLYLLFIVFCISMQSTQTLHNLYIINRTKSTLSGEVLLTLPLIIAPKFKKFTIKPGRTTVIDSKGYCFGDLRIKPIDGLAQKAILQDLMYVPPLTGQGMRCKDLEVKVIELQDNTLSIEGPSIPKGIYTAHIFNESNVDIHVTIDLTFIAFCGIVFEVVKAGENKKIPLGGCCAKSVSVRPITTDPHIIKEEYPFALPKTGLHERCGSFNLFIRQTSDSKRLILKDTP